MNELVVDERLISSEISLQEDSSFENMTNDSFINTIFQAATEALFHENVKEFIEYISYMPIDRLERDDIDETMISFILMCATWNKPHLVQTVFAAFDQNNPIVDVRPSFTAFFTAIDPFITIDLCRFVAKQIPEENYLFHFINLANFGNEVETQRAIERLEKTYGEQNISLYDEMMNRIADTYATKATYNRAIYDHCVEKIKQLSNNADVPIDIIFQNVLPTFSELEKIANHITAPNMSTPSILAATEMIMTDMKMKSELMQSSRDSVFQEIQEELQKMPKDEYNFFMKRYIDTVSQSTLQTNEELFKIYGPSFPQTGYSTLSENSENPCDRYGGCRMLLCQGHTPRTDIQDDEESMSRDWFTGSCCACLKKISKRHYAKRMPLPGGGWDTDCYCSWKCVKYDIAHPDIIQTLLLKYFKRKNNRFGIYDRIYHEEPVQKKTIDVAPGYFESLAGFPINRL